VAVSGTVVYAADPHYQKVAKFDSSGNSLGDLMTTGTTGFIPHYIRIHPENGNIYVKNEGGAYRVYQPDGTLVKSFSLPDGNLFTVLPDGRLHLSSGTIYNDLGILEKSGVPGQGGRHLRYAGGVCYMGYNYYGGMIYMYDANYQFQAKYGSEWWYWPDFGWRFAVNHKGDIIGNDTGTLYLIRRCEGSSMGPETRNAPPIAEVTKIEQRPNTTLLDIEYKVKDMDDATVQVAAAAFTSGSNTLSTMILLDTLMEGTETNLGPAIATGTTLKLTWDVGADWGADFGDVSVHIFTRDARSLLMGLHFLDLPAEGSVPAMKITRSPVHQGWFLEPLMWLAASKNPSVVFASGNVTGSDDAPDGFKGELLASGTSVTQKGRQFIESLMGTHEATAQEVQQAREAATPGIVNKWDVAPWNERTATMMKRIDGDLPRNVNEYSFDTGDYDANWFWLIKN
jgi:hypothetical protein